MPSSNELLQPGTFDLRQTLAERAYPTETVEFYVDEELGYAVNKLDETMKTLVDQVAIAESAGATEAAEAAASALVAAEEKYNELRKDAEPYKAVIRSISRRAKRDIQSKALHAYPLHRDLYGRDDSENEFARNHEIDVLLWTSCLQSITNPAGAIQVYDGNREVIEGVQDEIPESAYKVINAAIDRLLDDGERFDFAAQSEDFS